MLQKTGATGATSLLFKHNGFVIPGTNYDSLSKEPHTAELLIERLKPEDVDVIIIGSALIGRIQFDERFPDVAPMYPANYNNPFLLVGRSIIGY
jgi:hypothetical protein